PWCLSAVGVDGRPPAPAHLAAPLPLPETWLRAVGVYVVTTGLLVLLVTRAVRERERAEAKAGASERWLRLALDAASEATWSLDAATRTFTWDPDRPPPGGVPVAALPRSIDAVLAWIHPDDRDGVAAALDDVLAGRTREYHVEHRVMLPGGATAWIEARGRLHTLDGRSVLLGTIADVSGRRQEVERRAAAQAALLRLSTRDARGDRAAAVAEIVEVGARILAVDRCGFWRLDGDALVCSDLYVSPGRHEAGAVLSAEACAAYVAALRRQRALAAADARADERTRDLAAAYLEPHRVASMLCAPVHLARALVGVLAHEHVRAPRRWTAAAEAHAGSLADCVARAVEANERARAEAQLKRAYAQLGQLTRRLEAAKEEERRRISRELHDELGQTLTALKLHLQLLAKDPTAVADRLRQGLDTLDRAIPATRALARGMRPPPLDEIGLLPALQA